MRTTRSMVHFLWALSCLFVWAFAPPSFAAETAKKVTTSAPLAKKTAADTAMGKKCLGCHGAEDDPGIYAEWKKSSHAAKGVDCYDCHKSKPGDKDGFVRRVEFYDGATLIGSATASPWTASWTAVVGAHTITAKAILGFSAGAKAMYKA